MVCFQTVYACACLCMRVSLCFRTGVCACVYSRKRALAQGYLTGKPRVIYTCYNMANSTWLTSVIIAVIVANTVTLSMDYYGISSDVSHRLDIANIVFSTIFGAEMLIKLVGTAKLSMPVLAGTGIAKVTAARSYRPFRTV